MLKQKIDTAALFAQKKTEVQSSARTLLILDGQENAYISADELTEELLAIPEEGAIWLDMSLFGSHDQVMTVARSFKLSPATQNILENKKQPKRKRRARKMLCAYLYLRKITSCCSDIPEWQKRPCQHPGRVRHMRPQGTRGWRTGSLRSACRTASAHKRCRGHNPAFRP